MRLALLVALVIAASASAVQGRPPAKRAELRYWYHPTGHSCPAWQYPPATKPAADSARAACNRFAERWLKGVRCQSRSGRSTPSC